MWREEGIRTEEITTYFLWWKLWQKSLDFISDSGDRCCKSFRIYPLGSSTTKQITKCIKIYNVNGFIDEQFYSFPQVPTMTSATSILLKPNPPPHHKSIITASVSPPLCNPLSHHITRCDLLSLSAAYTEVTCR